MRVRIAYAVELTEVPEKVAELVSVANHMISRQLRTLERTEELLTDDCQSPEVCLEAMDKARQGLAVADQGLADAMNILGGYVEAMKPTPSEVLEVSAPPAQEPEVPMEEPEDV